VKGIEALVRWQHPTRGRVDPGRFIALTEETGLIVPIGRWILHEACAQAHRLDPRPDGPYVAVNVSAVQLHSPNLADDVTDALSASGLAPRRLLLELTWVFNMLLTRTIYSSLPVGITKFNINIYHNNYSASGAKKNRTQGVACNSEPQCRQGKGNNGLGQDIRPF
jgi:hypothetical protein